MGEPERQIMSLLGEAVEHRSPEERTAFLDKACAGDAGRRARVEELLRAYEAAGNFLQGHRPPSAPVVTVDDPIRDRPGAVIGPYKLLEQIGEGGFGVVFLAEQTQPVRRKVALKVLKPGMDTRQVVARFEAERQALALMDHPHIAKVLDGGETGSGRPYFVMELVKGQPITEYCDQAQLATRERLELFVHLCQAVQHAHQKGVIHRDLKPSNVLVTVQDTTPVVKVIDFGVAKALGQELTDKTVFTGFAQMIGTPLYMSPEQAGQSGLDVDTRSDIYSLGVLLYELLTGTTPFAKERLKEVGYDELRRIIREEEPPRPSTRISTLGEAAATVSANRRSDPKKLSRAIRGELDWIVMKALEKDRNRRYEAAGAFAADVRRYLNDEPVQACPPSAWYRLRKFARRNKTGLAVAGSLLFFIAWSAAGVGWFARDRAARQAKAVQDLEQVLGQAELLQAQGKRTDAVAALRQVELLATQAPGDPSREARLSAVRERLDADLRAEKFIGRLEDIRLRVESAVNLVESRFDNAGFPEIQSALHDYGIEIGIMEPAQVAAFVFGKPEPIRGYLVAALDRCLRSEPGGDAQLRQWLLAVLVAADNDPWRVRVRKAKAAQDWQALEQLGTEAHLAEQPPLFLLQAARWLPAERWAARLGQLRRIQRAYPADLWANHELAYELMNDGQPAEAVRYFTAALALRPGNPGIYLNRGIAFMRAGEVDAAIEDYAQCIALAPSYSAAYNNFGRALRVKGRLDEAVVELQKAIALDSKDPRPHHNLGDVLRDLHRPEEAVAEYHKAIALDPKYPATHRSLASTLHALHRLEEAVAEYHKAIALDPKFAPAYYDLGTILYGLNRLDEAVAEYHKAIALAPKYAKAHCHLGIALADLRRQDEAIAEFRQAIALDPKLPQAHYNLAITLCRLHRLDEAIPEYQKAIALEPKYAPAHCDLGLALMELGRLDAAITEYQKAIALDPNYAKAHCNLGAALHVLHRPEEAVAEYRKAIALAPHYPLAHKRLGDALHELRRLDEAAAEYRQALKLDADSTDALVKLGNILREQGRFTEAVAALRRGHELGSKNPHWPYPSAQWLREAERLVELDAKLPAILKGEVKPADAAEQVALACMCQLKKRHVNAARFFADALAAQPKLADDLNAGHRYNAACSAALAGCGGDKEADKLNADERARLRRQALDWLRADVAAWGRLLDREPDRAGSAAGVTRVLQNWLADPDLAGLRGPQALARLPEAERQPWQQLWSDLAGVLARAQAMSKPKKESDAK
jgi:tetratricopeptide (TPR) repeat protein